MSIYQNIQILINWQIKCNSYQNSHDIFIEIEKNAKIFMGIVATYMLYVKEKLFWRYHTCWFQSILKSYNSKYSIFFCPVAKSCWLFAVPSAAACQSSLSSNVSWIYSSSFPSSVGDAILSSVTLFSFCLQFSPSLGCFPISWLFQSGDQSVRASASVFPMNIEGWFL